MKAPAYSKYKASGVEWLGNIPEHWRTYPVRRVAQKIQTGSTPPTSEERFYEDGTVPWFGPGSFDEQITLSEPVKFLNQSAVAEGTARLFKSGATMVVTIGATLGKVSSLAARGSCNQQITVIEFDERRVFPRFGTYQLKRLEQALRAVAPSATLPILAQSDVADLFVGLPPLPEQHIIADFLDTETAKLDTLLAKKRELIEKLKEKRTALISQTVTRGLPPEAAHAAGLNPQPKFKPSGIEWLGNIPKHWEVKRLKYIATINDEALPETTDSSFEFTYVDISSVDPARGVVARERMEFENAPSRARRIARDGDTIVSTVRTYLRAIAPIKEPTENLIVSTGFAVVRPRSVEANFLSYALRESGFVETVVARSVGVSYPAVNASDVATIPIPLPPTTEQRAIADHLDRETAKIDRMVAKVEEAIERLQEYRTALITAAVTGKIDVRTKH